MEKMMVGWPEKATDEDKRAADILAGHTPLPVFDDVPARAAVLHEAAGLITGDRNNQYGPPTQDFRRTADALTAMGYRRLDTDEVTALPLVPSDVAIMVGMVKTSRLMHSRAKRDNWVDVAGYAGCGYECAVEESQG